MYLKPLGDLAETPATIVVPNGAAVATLNAALDHHAATLPQDSWLPPAVQSWNQYLAQRFDADALEGRGAGDAELVLSPDQEVALWRQVIEADRRHDIRSPERAAQAAREAWLTQHLHDLPPAADGHALTDDVVAFRGWAAAYRERSAALAALEPARLLARAAAAVADDSDNHAPADLVAHGFVTPPRGISRWFDRACVAPDDAAIACAGAAVDAIGVSAWPDRESELRAAFAWAADASRDGTRRVVIACDSLAQDIELARRAAVDVLGSAALDDNGGVCFGIREGLCERPAMRLARLLLALDDICAWRDLSAVVLHPLLDEALTERAPRARFDLWLRAEQRDELPLRWVAEESERRECPVLHAILTALIARREEQPQRQLPSAWFEHFDQCLRVAGWPDYARPERIDRQVLRAWGDAGDRMSALDLVTPRITRAAAAAMVRRLLGEATVMRSGSASLFVVAPEDALLVAPDAVWLVGCEAGWLLARNRTTPLLPLAQQRMAGVAGAAPAHDLAHARRLLQLISSTTATLQASFATRDGDLERMPSPLLPQLRTATLGDAAAVVPRGWQQPAAAIEVLVDTQGPAWTGGELRGGVGIVSNQGVCPFRAFARHRLGASAPEEPQPGIGARDKGTAVHAALAAVWQQIGDHAALAGLADDTRRALLRAAVHDALKPPRSATALENSLVAAERDRLLELLDAWLEFERGREPFAVIAREEPIPLHAGELAFTARVDRVERRADGRHVIVDYKTGYCSDTVWDTPRMRDAQLPLYALSGQWTPGGVALAEINALKPRWIEWPEADGDADAWRAQLEAWQTDIDEQAAAFAAGVATVDPKHGLNSCRYCDQKLLCRRYEQAALDGDADGDEEAGGDDGAG